MGAPFERFSHEAMATSFDLFIAGHPAVYARQAATAAFLELDRLETELSRYIESSDIGRANQLSRNGVMMIGDDALQCLLIAAEVSAATGGAFDPAYASTRGPEDAPSDPLYGLDPAQHQLMSFVERLHLDLGAVGKGYALDRMAELLRDWEITAACLQSGGSTVLALDPPPGALGWKVGLGEGPGYRTVTLSQRALSGSGLAVKGAHLIDPRTNQPATRVQRAWAFAKSATVADALSTAFFVMPDEDVAHYCERHPDVGAVLALPDGAVRSLGNVSLH
ncbi:MAG TPA: FAD:protein FMN transferase [Opitutaceae bacterium]|nr:FAD:protein FMN transferase [Opitutaceae bacterium]